MSKRRCEPGTLGRVVLGMGLCLLLALPAGAQQVRQVTTGDGYQGIVDAVSAAGEGDEIRVQAGTYTWTEMLVIETPNVTLSGGWDSGFQNRQPATSIITGADAVNLTDGYFLRNTDNGDGVVIDGFTFRDNDLGIVMRPSGSGHTTVINNVFDNNYTSFQTIFSEGGSVLVENNVFVGNSAMDGGWGTMVRGTGGDDAIVNRNVFYGNETGAGFFIRITLFTNNIVVNNTGGDGLVSRSTIGEASPANNLLWNNTGWDDGDMAGTDPGPNWVEDPLFVDAAGGDFRLQSGSPAIGAADDGGILGARDLPSVGEEDADPAPGPQYALEFPGEVGGGIRLGHDHEFDQGMTLEFWMSNLMDPHHGWQTILWRVLRITTAGQTIFNFGDWELRFTDPVWPGGEEWAHYAISYDLETARFYRDGELIHEVTESEDSYADAFQSIGNHGGDFERPFHGRLADMRVWDHGRSQSDIQAHMNQRLSGNESGLAAYWPMNEGSGSTANDLSGNNYHGDIEGTVAWIEADDLPIDVAPLPDIPDALTRGAALDFNGVDQYVDTTYQPSEADLGDGGTLEMWVYFRDDTQNFSGSWGAPRFYVARNEDGELQTGWGDDWDDAGDVPLNEWVHVAVTNDGSTTRGYLNGEELHSYESSFSGENSNLFAIGQARGTGRFTNGMIAEVRIWDHERPAAAIIADMPQRLTGDEDGLVGYWPLDEGEGDTAFDLSPNENDGTIVGAQWVSEDMPNLAGMHWTDAVTQLEELGFPVHIQYVQTGAVAAGQVYAQAPAAGATSAPYWPVVIQVEMERESFAPAAPAWLMLLAMTGVLAAAGYRMRQRVGVN